MDKDVFQTIADHRRRGLDGVVVTVVAKEGEGPAEVGKKMVVCETGERLGTVGGGALELAAIRYAETLLRERRHGLQRYALTDGKVVEDAKSLPMVCGGVVTLFFEFSGVARHVYLFGAGHVSRALANVLKTMNFHLTVIDERRAVVEAFAPADRLVHRGFADFITDEGIRKDAFVVVCTPNHKSDYHVINKIIELKLEPAYVGMLCSPEKLADYLEKTYAKFGNDIPLGFLYSPVGLDLGGGSPEEIAISITSELLALHHGKKGHRHMRENIDDHHRYW